MSGALHLQVLDAEPETRGFSKITAWKTMKICGYFLPHAMLIIILIYNLSSSNEIYVEGPTYTEALLKSPKQTTLPEITTCPLDNGYKKGILKVVVCIYNSLIYIPTLYLILILCRNYTGQFS